MKLDEKLDRIANVLESASSEFQQQVQKAREFRRRFERETSYLEARGIDRSRDLIPVHRPIFLRHES